MLLNSSVKIEKRNTNISIHASKSRDCFPINFIDELNRFFLTNLINLTK